VTAVTERFGVFGRAFGHGVGRPTLGEEQSTNKATVLVLGGFRCRKLGVGRVLFRQLSEGNVIGLDFELCLERLECRDG
jgi:hypothetical protein